MVVMSCRCLPGINKAPLASFRRPVPKLQAIHTATLLVRQFNNSWRRHFLSIAVHSVTEREGKQVQSLASDALGYKKSVRCV
jgi:hypothetical protein